MAIIKNFDYPHLGEEKFTDQLVDGAGKH